MVINMQAAAFWRGDIIKQVTIADFFKAGKGSFLNKLKNNPRQSFKSLRNKIQELEPWKNFINLNLKSNIEEKHYGTNYFIVKAELENLIKILDNYRHDMAEKDRPIYREKPISLNEKEHISLKKNLEDILILLLTVKPSSARARRKLKVEDVVDARGLSAPDRIRYINLHLGPFKKAVQTTESGSSGHIIYGKGTHKHLKALFEVKQMLQYIKDGNDPKGLDMVEKRLVREIRSELTTDVTIRDINEEGLETKTMSLWDAITFVGHIYGLYGVSDKAKRDEIIAATKQLGTRSRQNRETLEWIGEKFPRDFNEYDLLHDFNEYEFVLAEINRVTNRLTEISSSIEESNTKITASNTKIKKLNNKNNLTSEEEKEFKRLREELEELREELEELREEQSKLRVELAELEQEKNTIEQTIINEFNNEVLEEFKRRIALMNTPRRTYARTPGTTLAEDLSARQDINITEE